MTRDTASGKLRLVTEVARDFRHRGDHMVTTRRIRRALERLSSTASGAYRDGYGVTGYLYWDIELEP